jgi:hypothetical protein
MPLSEVQLKKILNTPKKCLIILRTLKQNFIKKYLVAIEILHFAGYIQKLRKIQNLNFLI